MKILSKIRPYLINDKKPWKQCIKKDLASDHILFVDSYIYQTHKSFFNKNKRLVVIKANENAKSLNGVKQIMQKIDPNDLHKKTKVICIGGGITQDVASFIASILHRGLSWIFYPTTLLAQADSCIGSKVSINFGSVKNLLGTFYPPEKVVIDYKFLKSLKKIDIASGLGEVLHYFLVSSPQALKLFLKNAPLAFKNSGYAKSLIRKSLRIKKKIIEIDEFDQGCRKIFNFGHTFGHALEAALNFKIPHGVAVAYGIDLANLVAVQCGLLKMNDRNQIRKACKIVTSYYKIKKIPLSLYIKKLSNDKKKTPTGINFILLKKIGHCKIHHLQIRAITHTIKRYFQCRLYDRDLLSLS